MSPKTDFVARQQQKHAHMVCAYDIAFWKEKIENLLYAIFKILASL